MASPVRPVATSATGPLPVGAASAPGARSSSGSQTPPQMFVV